MESTVMQGFARYSVHPSNQSSLVRTSRIASQLPMLYSLKDSSGSSNFCPDISFVRCVVHKSKKQLMEVMMNLI